MSVGSLFFFPFFLKASNDGEGLALHKLPGFKTGTPKTKRDLCYWATYPVRRISMFSYFSCCLLHLLICNMLFLNGSASIKWLFGIFLLMNWRDTQFNDQNDFICCNFVPLLFMSSRILIFVEFSQVIIHFNFLNNIIWWCCDQNIG